MAETKDLNVLNCGICKHLLNTPKSLPCLHMFCEPCLRKSFVEDENEEVDTKNKVKTIRCPVCSTILPVSGYSNASTAVSDLPTNRFIEALITRTKINSQGTICGPCEEDNQQQKATKWCEDCSEGLCDQCVKFHQRSKASKTHIITRIEEIGTNIILSYTPDKCKKHNEMRLELFCHDHTILCCVSCLATNHRKCEQVTSLKEAAQDVKYSNEIKELMKKIKDSEEICEEYLHQKQEEIEQLEKDKEDAIKKIEALRRDINNHLDRLESEMLQELNKVHVDVTNEIENLMKWGSGIKSIVINCDLLLSALLESSSDENLFLEKDEIRRKVKRQEDEMAKMTCDATKTRCVINFTPELENLISSVHCLGSVKSVKRSTIQYTAEESGEAQIYSPLSIKDCKANKIKAFETDKCDTSRVHGVELLSDGRILLTHFETKTLTLFKCDTIQKSVTFPDNPVDVTMISRNKAAVSFWDSSFISIVDIESMTVKLQNIVKNYKVYGITPLGENIIATSEESVLVTSIQGKVSKEIKQPSIQSNKQRNYVTVLQNGSICYTNPNLNSVTCIEKSGKEVFTYQHEMLERPHGITADSEDVIYVSGFYSSNVHQISPEGKFIKILLSKESGVEGPLAINIDQKNNRLVVTHSKSKITVFQMFKSD